MPSAVSRGRAASAPGRPSSCPDPLTKSPHRSPLGEDPATPQGRAFNEKDRLPDFLTDVFCGVLGYQRVVDHPIATPSPAKNRSRLMASTADAVLGEFYRILGK